MAKAIQTQSPLVNFGFFILSASFI
jgi:hypothetical protein